MMTTAQKEQRKAERQIMKNVPAPQIFIKDIILSNSWGYEQTNVDFYQIIDRTRNTITLQEIGREIVSTDTWASGKVMPDPSIKKGMPFKKRVQTWNGQEYVKAEYGAFSIFQGKPEFYSSWA